MEHLDQKKKITIMISIMTAMLFSSLNQTIVGTAVPRIIAELGGMDYFSWVFTIYMLTSSVSSILIGKLSDMYGRKPFILVGIGVFVLGTFLCGISGSIIELILYRGLQGIGGGMILSTSHTSIGDLFVPRERGRWQGVMSGAYGLASVFGPTLGGWIVDHAPWHWVFWVFLPLGAVSFCLIWYLFPSVPVKENNSVDYLGSLFLTLTIVPLLLAFSWTGQKYAWGSAPIIGLFAAAAASMIGFVLIEKRARNPILPGFLFKNPMFTLSNTAGIALGAGLFGTTMYVPFFVQGVLGTSATHSGFVTMPLSLSLVLGSMTSGQLISRTGKYKRNAIAGVFLLMYGMFLMSFMHSGTPVAVAILNMVIAGFGIGFCLPVFTLTVQNAVQSDQLGIATSTNQLFRTLGGTVGVSVMGTVLAGRMSARWSEWTAKPIGPSLSGPSQDEAGYITELLSPQVLLDPDKLQQIEHSMPAGMHGTFTRLIAMLRESLGYSLSGVFLMGAAIVAIAFVMVFFIKEVPLRTTVESPPELRVQENEQQLKLSV